MKKYIYPENLKSKPKVLFWKFKDFFIICTLILIAFIIFVKTWSFFSFAIVIAFAVMCVDFDNLTIKDYIACCFRFFITKQQIFKWTQKESINYGKK